VDINAYKDLTEKLNYELQQYREENSALYEEKSMLEKKIENNSSII